jgi:glutaredoxin-like protein NrdH
LNVTVYTTPKCVQCNLTKNWLKDNGVEYTTVNLATADESVSEAVKALGYMSAPVVIVNDDGDTTNEKHWYGFRPDLLEEFTTVKEAA